MYCSAGSYSRVFTVIRLPGYVANFKVNSLREKVKFKKARNSRTEFCGRMFKNS